MESSLNKKFDFKSLLKFAMPTIMMIGFSSLYTIVDAYFVSKYVGTLALSAINIVYPIYNIIYGIGFMFAAGGSAIVAKKLGENKRDEARESFYMVLSFTFILGIVLMLVTILFLNKILVFLGAIDSNYDLCLDYSRTFLYFTPFIIIQMIFQTFFITEGKPKLGLILTSFGGLLNIALDYIFMGIFDMGIRGASLATGLGLAIPAILGLTYFIFNNKAILKLKKSKWNRAILADASLNGSSEMVSSTAIAVVTFLYNIILMKYLGEEGVATISIMLYAQYFLNAIFIGFSMGVAPVISYKYGNQDLDQLKKIIGYCFKFMVISSVLSYIGAVLLSPLIVRSFAEANQAVYDLAIEKFHIFNISIIFAGVNIFSSAMFTAFSNGKVSAIISFLRTFVFISFGIIGLTHVFGIDGIWWAITLAEILSLIVSIYYIFSYREYYHY